MRRSQQHKKRRVRARTPPLWGFAAVPFCFCPDPGEHPEGIWLGGPAAHQNRAPLNMARHAWRVADEKKEKVREIRTSSDKEETMKPRVRLPLKWGVAGTMGSGLRMTWSLPPAQLQNRRRDRPVCCGCLSRRTVHRKASNLGSAPGRLGQMASTKNSFATTRACKKPTVR
jgi:hypothetical protein